MSIKKEHEVILPSPPHRPLKKKSFGHAIHQHLKWQPLDEIPCKRSARDIVSLRKTLETLRDKYIKWGYTMEIDYLLNHPEHVETVSKWIFSEFIEKTNSNFTLEQCISFFHNTHIASFPTTFIAIMGKECLGTISIFENDLKTQKELMPWLASFFVNPAFRGQGIGEALVKRVIEETRTLGFDMLYLRTEHTSEYYKKRGWSFVYQTIDEKGQKTEVFEYNLSV